MESCEHCGVKIPADFKYYSARSVHKVDIRFIDQMWAHWDSLSLTLNLVHLKLSSRKPLKSSYRSSKPESAVQSSQLSRLSRFPWTKNKRGVLFEKNWKISG